jgi:hypothetical protein
MNMENNAFEYTYSAKEQQEIEAIRRKYLPKAEDKMEQLRKLHAVPEKKAQAASIAAGVIGALILGAGMSLCMTDIGSVFGEFAWVLSILIGLAGMIPASLAYPIYKRTLAKERERIAPDILKLADELMQ